MGENAKAEQNFQRALAARAAGFGHPPQLGLVPVHARARAGVDRRVRAGDDATRCTRRPRSRSSTPAAAARRSATSRLPSSIFKRALATCAGQPDRRLRPRAARVPGGKYDEARGWMRPRCCRRTRRPRRCYLGVCVERKLGDKQAEMSFTSQLKNRYPDSAETRALPDGSLRVTESDLRASHADDGAAGPGERGRAAARRARRPRACRSTRSRSS